MIEPVISLANVSKKFPLYTSPSDRLKEALHPFRKTYHAEHWALRDISLDIQRGETIGIMGRNGAGKSTLLQLITSVLEPTAGSVKVHGRISALLELGAGFNVELTGRENVLAHAPLMGITRHDILELLPEIEAFADIGHYIDQPVKTYSSGMFVRLAFSMSISVDPDILIIDEALAVGDAAFQEKCFRKLKEFKDKGKTFLMVSHAASLIAQLCDRVVVIENGKIDFLGPSQEALIHYGKLMFGSVLPDDGLKVIALNGGEKRPLPIGEIDKNFGGTHIEKDQCSLRPGYNVQERRSGSNAAIIVDYLIVAGSAVDTDTVPMGEAVCIYVKTLFLQAVSQPRVAISIQTPAGLLIHGVNNKMKGLEVSASASGQTRIFCFSFLNRLPPDEYMVSLWIMEEQLAGPLRVDVRESIIILRSTGIAAFNGLIDLEMEFSEQQQKGV